MYSDSKIGNAPPSGLDDTKQYFEAYGEIISHLPYDAINAVAAELLRSYEDGKSVIIFGNGGSAALASHFACDLGKGTSSGMAGSRRFRVIALTDNVPLLTAWANDSCYEDVFAQQLLNFVQKGDVAFAISASGNSKNVLCALRAAREAGAITVGLAGFNGGKMKELCDHCIVVPSDNMQVVEDFQLSVSHALFRVVCRHITEAQPRYAAAASATRSALM